MNRILGEWRVHTRSGKSREFDKGREEGPVMEPVTGTHVEEGQPVRRFPVMNSDNVRTVSRHSWILKILGICEECSLNDHFHNRNMGVPLSFRAHANLFFFFHLFGVTKNDSNHWIHRIIWEWPLDPEVKPSLARLIRTFHNFWRNLSPGPFH